MHNGSTNMRRKKNSTNNNQQFSSNNVRHITTDPGISVNPKQYYCSPQKKKMNEKYTQAFSTMENQGKNPERNQREEKPPSPQRNKEELHLPFPQKLCKQQIRVKHSHLSVSNRESVPVSSTDTKIHGCLKPLHKIASTAESHICGSHVLGFNQLWIVKVVSNPRLVESDDVEPQDIES